jgi:hypothetical protein
LEITLAVTLDGSWEMTLTVTLGGTLAMTVVDGGLDSTAGEMSLGGPTGETVVPEEGRRPKNEGGLSESEPEEGEGDRRA